MKRARDGAVQAGVLLPAVLRALVADVRISMEQGRTRVAPSAPRKPAPDTPRSPNLPNLPATAPSQPPTSPPAASSARLVAASVSAPNPKWGFIILTRSERRFFMRPSPKINQILLYLLAVGAERYGMVVHWFCFMKDHYHAVVTDPLGNRPEFCRWFHEFVAKCVNSALGRWKNMWAPEPPSVVALRDEAAEPGESVYTLCNPVDAGLVKTGDE